MRSMDTSRPLSEYAFTAFDFETTGLYAGTDRIIELGAVRFQNGTITGEMQALVNPEMDIPEQAGAVSGITQQMVAKSPLLSDTLPEFMELAGDSILVAHNASFDAGFLRAGLLESGMGDLENLIIDTQALAQRAFPRLKSYALQSLVEHLGIPPNTAHRALDDSIMCMKVFLACADELSFMGQITLEEVLT